MTFSRRQFLTGTSALILTAYMGKLEARTKFPDHPFKLGVASGYPTPDGAVLWTRLAAEPFAPERRPQNPIPVKWEVASDDSMKTIVQQGEFISRPELAHSVHIELQGLQSNRPYWYRFFAGDEVSPIGRTFTTPKAGESLDNFRFAFASCQHYEQGYFSPYRDIVDADPQLILHLGDYIYEGRGWGPHKGIRLHEREQEPETLEEYRMRYATYRSDTDLQAAHAHAPWLVTWDDHEVDNDYAGIIAQDRAENFAARRAAAYQAYYENMPLPVNAWLGNGNLHLHRRVTFGDFIEFHVLDNRQYRSDHACETPERGGGRNVLNCEAMFDPKRTMLGFEQEKWLSDSFGQRNTHWNVMAQQMLFSGLDGKAGEDKLIWSDGWGGYSANRQRIIDMFAQRQPNNPVIIGGDIHSYWAADVKANFDKPESATVAT
ncbi:MAG: alkaline phosphatase D family protein, partial [Pseudomonadota bacterium]